MLGIDPMKQWQPAAIPTATPQIWLDNEGGNLSNTCTKIRIQPVGQIDVVAVYGCCQSVHFLYIIANHQQYTTVRLTKWYNLTIWSPGLSMKA